MSMLVNTSIAMEYSAVNPYGPNQQSKNSYRAASTFGIAIYLVYTVISF
jgi:hypothetical protein